MKKKIWEILNETKAERTARAGGKYRVTEIAGKQKPWGVMPWFRKKPGAKTGSQWIVGDPLTGGDVDLRDGLSLTRRHMNPYPLTIERAGLEAPLKRPSWMGRPRLFPKLRSFGEPSLQEAI